MSRLIDWESVCLVCLQKGENRCIFGEDNDSIVIADKIMTYSDILIKRDTIQPKRICLQCLDDLNVTYKFNRNYEQSESIIKGLLNTNHQEFQIKDLWKTSPTPGNPILDICIKDKVVDNTAVDDYCENTSCHVNRHLNRDELNTSTQHTEKKSLEKEIFQLQENTNSNEINIKHEIKEGDLIDDNCNIGSTPCIKLDNGPVCEVTNEEIVRQSKGEIPKQPRVRRKQLAGVSLKICEICNHGFKSQCALDIHIRRHNNVRPFSCDHCEKAFVSRADLQSHVRIHTDEKAYKCQYCDLRFRRIDVRKRHESKHTGERPFKCPTCDKSFGYSQDLSKHLRIHNKPTCLEFGREKVFKKHANRHLNRIEVNNSSEHTQKKSLEKEIFQIQENTNSSEIIIKHEIVEDDLIDHNRDNGSTPCIDVDNGPASEATKEEIPKQSTRVSLKICEICNQGCRNQSALDDHMRRHNNERPFSCDHCGKGFVTHSELRRHMRVHTGEKPYKCQYCDRRFSYSDARRNHERKHTGERPFKCPTCEKSYGYSSGLTTHLRYNNKCGKEYMRKKLFQKHVNRHLTRKEMNKSSEHTQMKLLEKEIFQIQENTNLSEINTKHGIGEDLIDDNCDIGSTSCIDVDNCLGSEATNGEIPKQSTRISLKICEICNQGCRHQNALDDHMRRHNNERPFNCDHCGKGFVTHSELRRHMRVHTGEKPYKCQYCDRRFSHGDARRNHESNHTGERPFKCPTCEKSYAYSRGLMIHLRDNNKCNKEDRRKKLFQKHVNRHLIRNELNKSSEHTQMKLLEKEIFQIQENTNSNEIIIKHEIVEDDIVGDNCDNGSTPCIAVDNDPVSKPTNGKIPKQSTGISLKICEICNQGCRNQSALNVHMRRHNNERPFSCDHCDKAFVSRGDLRSHVRIHTGEKAYKCHYCDLRFRRIDVRKRHESKHTDERPFKCPTCDKSFGYSQDLIKHLRIHNKPTCKEFRTEKVFKKHANRHLNRIEVNNSSEHTQKKSLEKEIFQIQENTISNEINIKQEIVENDLIGDNSDNGSTPSIDVDNCPVSEPTNREIVQQSKGEIRKHPIVRPKQSMGISLKICKICNHGFRKQYSLDVHMRRHNNERPFSCVQCGKAFVTHAELRRHVGMHTGEKPYKCQYCDLRFSRIDVRQSHESKHTGEKPFKCPTCDKSFGYSKGLREHLQTHNKFTCKECGKEFTGKVPFERHIAHHLAKGELDKSSEHEQKKRLEKEIGQIEE